MNFTCYVRTDDNFSDIRIDLVRVTTWDKSHAHLVLKQIK